MADKKKTEIEFYNMSTRVLEEYQALEDKSKQEEEVRVFVNSLVQEAAEATQTQGIKVRAYNNGPSDQDDFPEPQGQQQVQSGLLRQVLRHGVTWAQEVAVWHDELDQLSASDCARRGEPECPEGG